MPKINYFGSLKVIVTPLNNAYNECLFKKKMKMKSYYINSFNSHSKHIQTCFKYLIKN